ncbi:MAG: hypothetical protein IJP07_04855 [Firmicutes bacterium]|nr:hypothetical protein [Bacillota bacterium]
MTFDQMREMFEVYTGTSDEVDSIQLALWFNEAQLDLAYDLGPIESQELLPDEEGCIRPGKDWLTLLGCDLPFRRLTDGRLQLEGEAKGKKLYFRRMPRLLTGTDGTEESELLPALHYLPALFAASRYWDMESEGDGEESTHASKWLSYYYQGKNLAKARLELARGPVDGWYVY